jgi:hypothetical protein
MAMQTKAPADGVYSVEVGAPGFAQRARNEWRADQEEQAARNEVDAARIMAAQAEVLLATLERWGVPIMPGWKPVSNEIVIDGVTLVATGLPGMGGGVKVHVKGRCPICGDEVLSQSIYYLKDVGAELAHFDPQHTLNEYGSLDYHTVYSCHRDAVDRSAGTAFAQQRQDAMILLDIDSDDLALLRALREWIRPLA